MNIQANDLQAIKRNVIILTDVVFEETRYMQDQVPEFKDCDQILQELEN